MSSLALCGFRLNKTIIPQLLTIFSMFSFFLYFQKVICDHEIGNIFCACQDTDDLRFFAYITRDIQTARHYCHVFKVKSSVSVANGLYMSFVSVWTRRKPGMDITFWIRGVKAKIYTKLSVLTRNVKQDIGITFPVFMAAG